MARVGGPPTQAFLTVWPLGPNSGVAPKVESQGHLCVSWWHGGWGTEVSVCAWTSPKLKNFPECSMASGTSCAALEDPGWGLGVQTCDSHGGVVLCIGRSPQAGVGVSVRAGLARPWFPGGVGSTESG